jgi:outer membrane protein assembly factor BamB
MTSQLAFVAVSAVLIASTALAQDYPQWRGPGRDGSASAFVEPNSWPKTLTRRWKVDVGEGYATPIVVAETVFVFTRRDGNEVMTALDARTGAQRWQSTYPASFTPTKAAAAHGAGPKATPLFH